MDRYTQFAMVAAEEAVKDSGISTDDVDPYRFGVIVGSAAADLTHLKNSIIQ